VEILSPDHGEHPDQDFKSWHCLNDIAEASIPKIIIVHASGYDNMFMFIFPLVTGILYQHRLTLVDWNSKHIPFNSARLDNMCRAVGIFADKIIIQWKAMAHIGVSAFNKRVICKGNQVVVMNSFIPQSFLLKRIHTASTCHHIRELIACKIIGYHSVCGKFNPAHRLGKQWKHYKIWNHLKTLLFYSGDPGDLIKPAENVGGEGENHNNLNISTTTHPFQTIKSAIEMPTPLETLQAFHHCNQTSIDDDMTILVNTIETQFRGIIPVLL
jgi:hypothetical protein